MLTPIVLLIVATINDLIVFFSKNPIEISMIDVGNPVKIPKDEIKINFIIIFLSIWFASLN